MTDTNDESVSIGFIGANVTVELLLGQSTAVRSPNRWGFGMTGRDRASTHHFSQVNSCRTYSEGAREP